MYIMFKNRFLYFYWHRKEIDCDCRETIKPSIEIVKGISSRGWVLNAECGKNCHKVLMFIMFNSVFYLYEFILPCFWDCSLNMLGRVKF